MTLRRVLADHEQEREALLAYPHLEASLRNVFTELLQCFLHEDAPLRFVRDPWAIIQVPGTRSVASASAAARNRNVHSSANFLESAKTTWISG